MDKKSRGRKVSSAAGRAEAGKRRPSSSTTRTRTTIGARLRPSAESGTPDVVRSYLKAIRASALLTFEQEQELGKRTRQGDPKARTVMIEANLRLVVSNGKRYLNRGLPFSDIIEE